MNRTLTVTVAAILAMPAGVRGQQHSEKPLAARVQRLEDIQAIQNLLLEYGRTLDAHDLKAYSNLFAKDGEWAGGFGTAKTPAGILAMMEKNLPPPAPGSKKRITYHLMTNFIIEVHGDTGTAWSRWTFVVPGPNDQPEAMHSGHYEDTLVRENGKWRFQRRMTYNDIPYLDPPATK